LKEVYKLHPSVFVLS